MIRSLRRLGAVAATCVLAACGGTGSGGDGVAIDDSVVMRAGVEYGVGSTADGEIPLVLDLFIPVVDGEERIDGRPAAIVIHGGAYVRGSRTGDEIQRWAIELARAGFVTASIDYRLARDEPVVETPEIVDHLAATPFADDPDKVDWLPWIGAATEDALAAATWLVDQGVDRERIAIGGSSAGAHTALYAAFLPNDVGLDAPSFAAVVDLWGGFRASLGDATLVDPDDPPVWIVHGADDDVVIVDYADDIADRGTATGVEVILHRMDGRGHGWAAIDLFTDATTDGVPLIDDQLAFLRRHLDG